MVHDGLLYFHIFGMILLVGSGLFLLLANPGESVRNKTAVYLVSAAHTQFLTGLILFLLDISEINPAKYGVKILLVIALIIIATIYRKRLKAGIAPLTFLLPAIVILSFIITGIAFFWK
jgi:hypothetical protein